MGVSILYNEYIWRNKIFDGSLLNISDELKNKLIKIMIGFKITSPKNQYKMYCFCGTRIGLCKSCDKEKKQTFQLKLGGLISMQFSYFKICQKRWCIYWSMWITNGKRNSLCCIYFPRANIYFTIILIVDHVTTRIGLHV